MYVVLDSKEITPLSRFNTLDEALNAAQAEIDSWQDSGATVYAIVSKRKQFYSWQVVDMSLGSRTITVERWHDKSS